MHTIGDSMKNKKWFTLVEVIAVPFVLNYIYNANDQTYPEHEKAMEQAARIIY